MAGRRFPLVLIPRYTTYVADGHFSTVGLDVSRFESAVVHVWRGVLIGTTPTMSVTFEESTDHDEWTACTGGTTFSPSEDTEIQKELTLKKRFLRALVELGGTDVAVTSYAVGYLIARTD